MISFAASLGGNVSGGWIGSTDEVPELGTEAGTELELGVELELDVELGVELELGTEL